MNQTEGTMEDLQRIAKAGREYFDRYGELNLRWYVERFVMPVLKDVLKNLCLEIEERHKVDEPEDEKDNFVIHYTSIGNLVSMLKREAKNRQNAAKNEQNKVKDEQNATEDKQDVAKDEQESSKDEQNAIGERNASLRLYDSVHFNDPDEGNYFYRNLNLRKKYAWLGEKRESHAYIASFILPDPKNKKRDMSDDLVFWRTYGKEGEGCSLKLRIPRDRLRKVLYGPNEVKCTGKDLRPVLEAIHPLVSIRKPSLKKEVREKLVEVIWKSLEKICYLYKSEAYEYESECRFVIPELEIEIVDKDKICFEDQEQNNSTPRIRHYYEDDALKVKNILTTGSLITLGPCVPYPYNMSYYHNMSYYLGNLLRKAGLFGPEIKISEISYRKP